MPSISDLLATYPRHRPPLPPAQQAIYVQEYRRNRQGADAVTSLAQKAESWMHRQIAAENSKGGDVLEIGAGSLNHLPYERERAGGYDVIEPFSALYEDSAHRHLIRDFYPDISVLPKERRYGRIISIAVLEHLSDLPAVIARAALHLREDGLFQAAIPSEGGFLWGLGWRLTTGLSYRLRTGHSYATLMRHEHINEAAEIITLIRHFFADVTIRRFPLPANHLSLYACIRAKKPRSERCRDYLLSSSPEPE